MRRRLSFLVAATTSAIVLAFLIPLALLLARLADTQATNSAQSAAQFLAPLALDAGTPDGMDRLITQMALLREAGAITVLLDDGTQLGFKTDDPQLARTQTDGRAITAKIRKGAEKGDTAVYVPAVGGQGAEVVRVLISSKALQDRVRRSTLIITGLAAVSLIGAVFAADLVARRVSAPMMAVATAADALRQGRLETRAPLGGTHEVVAMAQALNGLATRIEQLLATERDAVADLSHRLRTPVTALRLDADGIADPEVAERVRMHVAHLERTVDAVVRDAKRPVRETMAASCDICRVVGDRVAFWSALAYDQGRVMHLTMPDREVRARLQSGELTDVVDVLLDNVFAHTDEGVEIEVSVSTRLDGSPVLTVEDAGPGLPPGDIVSRGSSGAGSTGLGLDIVRRAALASGGQLELGRSRLGGALIRATFGPG
jgi:signal transduction histidine kinase